MRILVTGASGFVGQYMQTHLKSIEQVAVSLQNKAIAQVSFQAIDAIVYLAGIAHRMQGAPRDEYFQINCEQAFDFAQAAKKNGVKHFIFMSTAKVFGEQSLENQAFDLKTIPNPQDDYARSKLAAEKKILSLEDEGFKIAIIRPPVIYGPMVKGNIKSLAKLIEKNIWLPFKNIHNQRSVLFVGNLIAFIEKILLEKKSGIFLIADAHSVSLKKLVEWMQIEYHRQNINAKTKLVILPEFLKKIIKRIFPKYYIRLFANFEIDPEQSFKMLNFQPPFSTEEGIARSQIFTR